MRTPDENARAQVAHDMAFNELPPRAHSDMGELRSEFEEPPDMAVARYFLQAAKHRGVKANADDIRRLRVHTGQLDDRRDFIAVEYPRFPVIDLLADLSGGLPPGAGGYVLAPYFSAIAFVRDTDEANCFVLSQSLGATTTLRVLTPTRNLDLGTGCEPELNAFLKLVRRHSRKQWGDDD